ncbi:MAG: co-chaperone DjlA [Halioglobus sp.]
MYGKLIGGILGFLAGGFFGLILGLLGGHAFDRGVFQVFRLASPKNLKLVRDTFFDTTFLLCGHLAKADGRISEAEVAHAEQLFLQLGLQPEQRKQAIAQFQAGAAPSFKIEDATKVFIATCGRQPQLVKTLLLFLISQAHADSKLDEVEREVLINIARELGVDAVALHRLINMAQAQQQFHSGAGGAAQTSRATSIEAAYAALGVDSTVDDKGLKRAYRKLMSEHHPDKLIAKGVPEAMIKGATERSQEIQSAYEAVRKHRGLVK